MKVIVWPKKGHCYDSIWREGAGSRVLGLSLDPQYVDYKMQIMVGAGPASTISYQDQCVRGVVHRSYQPSFMGIGIYGFHEE
jgi:hypothetical protein